MLPLLFSTVSYLLHGITRQMAVTMQYLHTFTHLQDRILRRSSLNDSFQTHFDVPFKVNGNLLKASDIPKSLLYQHYQWWHQQYTGRCHTVSNAAHDGV